MVPVMSLTPLKDMVAESNRLLKETGAYWGTKEFKAKTSDPARYARFGARLVDSCVGARSRARYVSASPAAREMGEILFSILSPDGDPVGISMGLIAHIGIFGDVLRWMLLNDYEVNPGIHYGDIFETNDPKVGSVHTADVFTFLPIFHEGQVVAWAAAINHVLDVGAGQPGSVLNASPNSFTDGFVFPPIKTGMNFQHESWWYHMWHRRTRVGTLNVLDAKARLAGCKILHDKVLQIVQEFGAEYFRQACREMVQDGWHLSIDRMRTLLVPSTAQCSSVYKIENKGWTPAIRPDGDKDTLNFIYVDAVVDAKTGVTTFRHHRTAREQPNAHNAYIGAIRMVYFPSLTMQFLPLGIGNAGSALTIAFETEPGTCLDPADPFAACSGASCMSKARCHPSQAWFRSMFARGYLEECMMVDNNWVVDQGGGILSGGLAWAFSNFEWAACWSSGAYAFKDGETSAMCDWSPETDSGSAEEWKLFIPPLTYLGRKYLRDSCGHGKYRGGLGQTSTFVCLDPGVNMSVNGGGCGGGSAPTACYGFGGGYPSPGIHFCRFHGTNMRQLIEQGDPYPRDIDECLALMKQGKLTVREMTVYKSIPPSVSLEDGDIWWKFGGAGSGYGDPLERDLGLVEKDLNEGNVSPETAKQVYGAAATQTRDGQWRVDPKGSEALRANKKQERRSKSVPAAEWFKKARARWARQDFPDLVKQFYAENMTESRKRWLNEFWHTDIG